MFGASYFADIDFDRSMFSTQLFKHDEDAYVELPGVVLKLNEHSTLVYDIKKFDLKSGQMTDYGFAVQPLIHVLKNNHYLIGGRYQLPVYKGSVPSELLAAQKAQNPTDSQKPRLIFKRLLESGRLEQMEVMQLVSSMQDLNPPEDQPPIEFNPIPSMLHHVDKVNLEQFSLEEIFSRYDDDNAAFFENERFAPQLTLASKFKTTADVIQGSKEAFKNSYMK